MLLGSLPISERFPIVGGGGGTPGETGQGGLGLEPDGMTSLLLSQHSQRHCSTDQQAQQVDGSGSNQGSGSLG